MHCTRGRLVAGLAVAVAAAGGAAPPAEAQARRHPGRVVEMDKPFQGVAAGVKAWPDSKQTSEDGGCPVYGSSPLDARQSDAKAGDFALAIDPKVPTYTITYCAPGYFPRADRDVANTGDGTPIVPRPVELLPRADKEPRILEQAMRAKLAGLLADLAYLQRIDPGAFERVAFGMAGELQATAPQKAAVVREVHALVLQWQRQ
jgi:hypothetical protein